MPKLEINSKTCKACELCILNCPKNVIELGENCNASGYHYAVAVREEDCIACKMCAIACPDAAIEIWK